MQMLHRNATGIVKMSIQRERVGAIHDARLKFVGRDETRTRMEVAELPRPEHHYNVGYD